MAKKIIILNGSPRANGNTSALTAQFKKGAEEAGNEVIEFHLSKMKIGGCLGCWHGGKDPVHPCVQRDDMEKIYPAYREADVVALAAKRGIDIDLEAMEREREEKETPALLVAKCRVTLWNAAQERRALLHWLGASPVMAQMDTDGED